MDDFSETHSSSLYMSTNKIIRVPVKEADKWKAVNDWVATGTYSFGCPGSWLKYPAPIHMLAERTNEDPAYPPYRPPKNIGAAPSWPDDSFEDHQLAEEDFRNKREFPAPESIGDELSEMEDDELFEQPEEQDNELHGHLDEEIDENNSNSLWDYIDEAEEIVYDSWITYMYPILTLDSLDNNDPLWVDPEQY